MATSQSPESKELALVGKVEMRIALADSEKKLEDLLKVYLAPLLLKLGSEYVAVRNKVRHLILSVWEPALAVCLVNTADCRFLSRSSQFASTSTPASSHSTLRTPKLKSTTH
jgi:hypothetical protein